jgi:surface protein
MMGSAALLCVLSLLEAVAGTALHDGNIKTAVAAWLSDSAAAEAAYGHISTWETGGVTDMSYLFCAQSFIHCNTAAASFNEDIGAWDTSGVTTMRYMFYYASAFNRDIGGWAVHSVKDMGWMFLYASAFNQDIGGWAVDSFANMRYMFYDATSFDQDLDWCVEDDVDLDYAFSNTQCESTACGVKPAAALKCGGGPMSDFSIRLAVTAWLSDPTAAEATYGHISTWATGGVTTMSGLFQGASSFNEDIGAWDTSGVTDMSGMFGQASAFDQDLSWCVDDDVSMVSPFYGTLCASTFCGVSWGGCDIPSSGNVMANGKIRLAVTAWLSDATAAEAAYGHISTWETGGVTDMDYLFCAYGCGSNTKSAASYFNEDIGAWDTSGVTTMYMMFREASAFNRHIGGWAVHSVTNMGWMFNKASAFDQDLGWCVDDGVGMTWAFYGTSCVGISLYGITGCGVKQVAGGCAPTPAPSPAPTSPAPTPAPTVSPLVADDSSIRTAVARWLSNPTAAEATYGHISTWETGGVTDMSHLFCASCGISASSFNEDIGAWDTSAPYR